MRPPMLSLDQGALVVDMTEADSDDDTGQVEARVFRPVDFDDDDSVVDEDVSRTAMDKSCDGLTPAVDLAETLVDRRDQSSSPFRSMGCGTSAKGSRFRGLARRLVLCSARGSPVIPQHSALRVAGGHGS